LGLGLAYTLKTHQFLDFCRYPLVGGVGTYLVALLHIVIIAAAILIFISVKKTWKAWRKKKDISESGLAIRSLLLVSGVLLTLTGVGVQRHYLIMTFPLEWVWLSRFGLRDERSGQKYLMILWVAQLLISVMLLVYLHLNHGAEMGDYGIAYQYQGK